MTALVADRVQQREKLDALHSAIQRVQQKDKQVHIDDLLDKINDTKSAIVAAYESAVPIPDSVSELAWFTDIADEELENIKALLGRAEKLSHNIVKFYADASRTYVKFGLDRTALRQYKEVADRIKEVVVDVRDRIFVLPQDEDFMSLMQELNDIA